MLDKSFSHPHIDLLVSEILVCPSFTHHKNICPSFKNISCCAVSEFYLVEHPSFLVDFYNTAVLIRRDHIIECRLEFIPVLIKDFYFIKPYITITYIKYY